MVNIPAVLCIETSSQVCSVALTTPGHIFYKESPKTQAHAEALADLVKDCLAEAGIQFKDLQAVAISEGPGSYTGLRIGTSLAKGLCFALKIPLIPINTLKIIAYAALQKGTNGLIWPMIDARRMEVYHAVFDRDLNMLTTVNNGIITDADFVPSMINEQTSICGDGADKAQDILKLHLVPVHANAASMCPLAMQAYTHGQFADLVSFEPFYLKQANITAPGGNNH
jgi:tRNA threonylcarbamoyladenosine biosynthesis protein TsaB